ncbi:hypothetical protein DERF_010895 [Dermatophagoides farinae]|uniref:Uncharacterized protein n=1 Tax=Dermatophagoides farinae TaxID=6954 RepID=A0A922L150_DERFA|nr:hypothetical protein DERF_010895 [Dermatophagoides farinae]
MKNIIQMESPEAKKIILLDMNHFTRKKNQQHNPVYIIMKYCYDFNDGAKGSEKQFKNDAFKK